MRVLHLLQRLALAMLTVATTAGVLSNALDQTLTVGTQQREETAPNIAESDLFNRAIYDVRGLFVGHVADVRYSVEDGEAYLLIAGVGSLLGGAGRDVALSPSALRGVVRDHRRILVADTSREALQASAAVRFDAASATWVPADAYPKKSP